MHHESGHVKGVWAMASMDRQARHRASTAAVLEYAWEAAAFGADHLIAALGLTRSTALAAVDTLIEIGLVSELSGPLAEPGQRIGRPARR